MTDVGRIKSAARGRGAEILQACGIDPAVLDGRHHPCPRCGGTDRFRFDREKEFAHCSQCFNKQNGDVLAAARWYRDCSFPEVLRFVGDLVGIETNGNGRGTNGNCDIVADIAARKRVPLDAFRRLGARAARRGKMPVCRIPMYDERGEQCSELDMATSDDKWLKGYTTKGKPAGLFLAGGRLPQPGQTIVVVEGPKDAATLDDLGYSVVGLPTCEMNQKFVRVLRECHVILVPDRDKAGEAGARKSAARLIGVAASVRIATLPTEWRESRGDDVRDILARHDGESLLRQAIDDAQEWKPPHIGNGKPTGTVNEDDNDPHRLARVCLSQLRRLRYWQGVFYLYVGTRYVAQSDAEIRSTVTRLVKQEFNRINRERAFR